MKTRSILSAALIVAALGVIGWTVFGPVTPSPTIDTKPTAAPTPPPTTVQWDTLAAYVYEPGLKELPASIRALDGKQVVMEGHLTPLYEFDDIHEFTLVATKSVVPTETSGQVKVRIAAKKGIGNTLNRLRVIGTFTAKEVFEQGYILSIFEIEDAAVEIL